MRRNTPLLVCRPKRLQCPLQGEHLPAAASDHPRQHQQTLWAVQHRPRQPLPQPERQLHTATPGLSSQMSAAAFGGFKAFDDAFPSSPARYAICSSVVSWARVTWEGEHPPARRSTCANEVTIFSSWSVQSIILSFQTLYYLSDDNENNKTKKKKKN